jgi:hypothetical protein
MPCTRGQSPARRQCFATHQSKNRQIRQVCLLLTSYQPETEKQMAVNTIGQSTYASGLQQKQQNMNNMFSALKSGDMASAQKAYAASGLPPQATNNTSPLGRLYQALRHEDLAGAQKAALDMQGKSGKSASAPVHPTPSNSSAQTPVQKTAAALAQASVKAQQSSILAMLGQGTNVNTWG